MSKGICLTELEPINTIELIDKVFEIQCGDGEYGADYVEVDNTLDLIKFLIGKDYILPVELFKELSLVEDNIKKYDKFFIANVILYLFSNYKNDYEYGYYEDTILWITDALKEFTVSAYFKQAIFRAMRSCHSQLILTIHEDFNPIELNVNTLKFTEETKELKFKYSGYVNNIVLPDKISILPEYCFEGCTQLSTINLQNIKEIKKGALYYYTDIDTLSINDDCHIEDDAISVRCLYNCINKVNHYFVGIKNKLNIYQKFIETYNKSCYNKRYPNINNNKHNIKMACNILEQIKKINLEIEELGIDKLELILAEENQKEQTNEN